MNGAMNTASSRDSCIIPATKCWPTSDSPYGPAGRPSAACIKGVSAATSQRLMWRCPDEPVQCWSGLAMKVMPQPFR